MKNKSKIKTYKQARRVARNALKNAGALDGRYVAKIQTDRKKDYSKSLCRQKIKAVNFI
jgi:hypothetical protein